MIYKLRHLHVTDLNDRYISYTFSFIIWIVHGFLIVAWILDTNVSNYLENGLHLEEHA